MTFQTASFPDQGSEGGAGGGLLLSPPPYLYTHTQTDLLPVL